MRTCKGCRNSVILEHDCISCKTGKFEGVLVSNEQAKHTYLKVFDEEKGHIYVSEKCKNFKER